MLDAYFIGKFHNGTHCENELVIILQKKQKTKCGDKEAVQMPQGTNEEGQFFECRLIQNVFEGKLKNREVLSFSIHLTFVPYVAPTKKGGGSAPHLSPPLISL